MDELEQREAAEQAARAHSPSPDFGGAEDEAAGDDTEMPDTAASASAGDRAGEGGERQTAAASSAASTGDRAGGSGSAEAAAQQEPGAGSSLSPGLTVQNLAYYQEHASSIIKKFEKASGMSKTRRPRGIFIESI